MRSPPFPRLLFTAFLLCLAGTGCSIRRFALNQAADALAGSGTAFASDDDPDLIRAAAPFSLKLMESLLAENPRHPTLATRPPPPPTLPPQFPLLPSCSRTPTKPSRVIWPPPRRCGPEPGDSTCAPRVMACAASKTPILGSPTPCSPIDRQPPNPPPKPMCRFSTGPLPPGPPPSRFPKTILTSSAHSRPWNL